jgi:hypothetical protein
MEDDMNKIIKTDSVVKTITKTDSLPISDLDLTNQNWKDMSTQGYCLINKNGIDYIRHTGKGFMKMHKSVDLNEVTRVYKLYDTLVP